MKKSKLIFSVLPFVIFALSVLYFHGCSSAESTTGKLAFQQKDFVKAEMELKKGLSIDQNDDEGWFMLGYSQVENGNYAEAQKSFKRSLSISNNFNDKIQAYWVEKFNQGARDFKSGIESEEKKNTEAAQTYYKNALKNFEESSVIFPDSLKSFSAMGETYLALGNTDKALEIFSDIASKSTNKLDAERVAKILFESGLGMMSTKNYSAASETFKKVLAIKNLPRDDEYYETSAYNNGLALAKMGEDMRVKDENSNYKQYFSEALASLEPLTVSLKKKDLEKQVYELLISVYANLGMTDKAQDALKKKQELEGK
ncbi:MAG: tetratricopeptide repeat protein [Bacteroidetes bacterium]|nr:tetratricopeptide repeat protein [Bacteroidota bacterium]